MHSRGYVSYRKRCFPAHPHAMAILSASFFRRIINSLSLQPKRCNSSPKKLPGVVLAQLPFHSPQLLLPERGLRGMSDLA